MKSMTARAAALAAKSPTYETGIPCKQGHIAPRATRTGTCVECTKAAAKAWLAQHPAKSAEYSAAYRARNQAQVRSKDREAQAQRRAANPERHRTIQAQAYARAVAAQGREVRPRNRLRILELEPQTRVDAKEPLSAAADTRAPARTRGGRYLRSADGPPV